MENGCPVELDNSEENSARENWNKAIPIPDYLKKSNYGVMKYLIFLHFITPLHLIGLAFFAALFLPTMVTGILAIIFFIYPLIRQVLRHYEVLPTPHATEIIRSTYTARFDGDFVVFLIGSRPNRANAFNKEYVQLGKAFNDMIEELESDPTSGFMGGDVYIGANERKSTTLSVQYWRDYESLQRWTHQKMGRHIKVAIDYRKSGLSTGNIGIWHETYKVRDGEYEVIYGNMPPIGLALATTAVVETKSNNGPMRMLRRQKEKEAKTSAVNEHQD